MEVVKKSKKTEEFDIVKNLEQLKEKCIDVRLFGVC